MAASLESRISALALLPGARQPLGPLRSQIMGTGRKQRNIFKVKKKNKKKKSHPLPACPFRSLSESLANAVASATGRLSPRGAAGTETALDHVPWSPTASSHRMLRFGHPPGLFILNSRHPLSNSWRDHQRGVPLSPAWGEGQQQPWPPDPEGPVAPPVKTAPNVSGHGHRSPGRALCRTRGHVYSAVPADGHRVIPRTSPP